MSAALFSHSITVTNLDAYRGGNCVAQNVSFALRPNQALTLRGENGTGKTSILRAIAGFSRTATGVISFFKDDTLLDPIESRATQIHWLGGGDGLAEKLTVEENVAFWAGLHRARTAEVHNSLSIVGLLGVRSQLAGKLSTGQRRRLGLCRLIMRKRALWLLDEPMNGLDSDGREVLQQAISSHRAAGGIVLMASHEHGLDDAPVLRLNRMAAA